ncbi:hypothetical protein ACQP0C_02440 [Nocardia sp. CA-129566]|uniref:hypothetical protein n=1 Tax=Nocardia sp. CA-129566 TaxID=3239976 RepID=UPI003D99A7BB
MGPRLHNRHHLDKELRDRGYKGSARCAGSSSALVATGADTRQVTGWMMKPSADDLTADEKQHL